MTDLDKHGVKPGDRWETADGLTVFVSCDYGDGLDILVSGGGMTLPMHLRKLDGGIFKTLVSRLGVEEIEHDGEASDETGS